MNALAMAMTHPIERGARRIGEALLSWSATRVELRVQRRLVEPSAALLLAEREVAIRTHQVSLDQESREDSWLRMMSSFPARF